MVQNHRIKNLNKRHRKEQRFKILGMLSISLSLVFLAILLVTILGKGSSAFIRTQIALEINLTAPETLDLSHRQIIKKSLQESFPEAKTFGEINSLWQILSKRSAFELKQELAKEHNKNKEKLLIWFTASSKADMFFKHQITAGLNENQLLWLSKLKAQNQVRKVFNWNFFSEADSREAEVAGIGAGLAGSFLVMMVFLVLSFPIGVMCAFYLEEFAPKNRLTDIIEVSINNLAAIPSIIYGLLGLVLYLQIMHLPRSSSIVGGMTLFMLVLPVIIIATRNTIRSIPGSIRDGAYALGASKMQTVLHHLLPLSVPGIMTGTILAISRALGETAPLLMIGMIAFIADVPKSFLDPTTVLPVQIYLWSDSPEYGFAEKTAAAILILLLLLIFFNLFAIILRKKFERRWA